jgi:hypothetical protein
MRQNSKKLDKIWFVFENLQIPIEFVFEKQCTQTSHYKGLFYEIVIPLRRGIHIPLKN